MTALRVPARPEQDASLRPVPWRRMAWVTWRQHRIALAGAAALLGALALYLGLTGLQIHRNWTAAVAAFAIGALAGMLIRRVVPAITATLAAYTGLALVAGLYPREHYMTPRPSGWSAAEPPERPGNRGSARQQPSS